MMRCLVSYGLVLLFAGAALVLVDTEALQQQQQQPPKKAVKQKPVPTAAAAAPPSAIRDVAGIELSALVDDNEDLLVLFHDAGAKSKNRLMLKILEKLDTAKQYNGLPFVKTCTEVEEALELFGIGGVGESVAGEQLQLLPKLVLFQNGLPEVFAAGSADLTELAAIKTWLKEELESNDLDVMEMAAVERYTLVLMLYLVRKGVFGFRQPINYSHGTCQCDTHKI